MKHSIQYIRYSILYPWKAPFLSPVPVPWSLRDGCYKNLLTVPAVRVRKTNGTYGVLMLSYHHSVCVG